VLFAVAIFKALLTQRLRCLFSRLFIPHIIPQFGIVILFQETAGRVQFSPLFDNFHSHEGLVQSFGIEIQFLLVFDHLAVQFVARVVIRPSATAE
jgi:hypothetical protein